MSRILPLKPNKLIKVLQKAGFQPVRRKGSHVILMNERRTRIVIPVHPGKEVKPTLVRAILKEAGLSREEFNKLLEQV
ncbi:TPA: addiction module toxin, HicA family [Candidatus Bathyarchaeota archaeon]|nr:addiction module toxin, HicA family [Candidatus Bathyarchaeota archaeon]